MGKSEFGKGLCYNLGLFVAHEHLHTEFMEYGTGKKQIPGIEHDNNEKAVERKNFYLREGPSLWFYGAADHLFDLQIPANLPVSLQRRIKSFRKKCLSWRLCMGVITNPTIQDYKWAIKEAKTLLRLIDKHNGVTVIKGDWE